MNFIIKIISDKVFGKSVSLLKNAVLRFVGIVNVLVNCKELTTEWAKGNFLCLRSVMRNINNCLTVSTREPSYKLAVGYRNGSWRSTLLAHATVEAVKAYKANSNMSFQKKNTRSERRLLLALKKISFIYLCILQYKRCHLVI